MPVKKCKIDQKEVTKFVTDTQCDKVPRKLCAPRGCGVKEVKCRILNAFTTYHPQGPRQCESKVQVQVSDTPVEECDLEPRESCEHVTKLLPRLKSVQRCVQVYVTYVRILT